MDRLVYTKDNMSHMISKYFIIALLLLGCKSSATMVRYTDKESFDVFCQDKNECMDRVQHACLPHYFKIENQGQAQPSGFVVTAICISNSTVQ